MELKRQMEREILEHSYLAQIGHLIEPVLKPVGFSWREGVALLAGLSAKEVVVSTMALLYRTGEKGLKSLKEAIRNSISFPTAVALIVFIMFYSPCLAAMATFWSEVPQWQWRLFYTIYPNLVAWLFAFIAYRLAGG
jgi:ferrous iron transport protein B